MKKPGRVSAIGMFFLFAVLLSACSSTKLVSSWTAPNDVIKSNKVLVIALMGQNDRMLRENVERIMVKNLSEKGINAGSAFAEYGPKVFEGLNEAAALKAIKDKGYDGTFTIAVLDKTKQKTYNYGAPYFNPYYGYRFWGYYNNFYGGMYEPGYYSTTKRFILEANYYNLDNDKLLYSAQTRSLDPSSPESLATEFTNTLLADMTKKGVIK
ncbi:hypothetical protein [Pedobacter metabolipauper]|uniref:DUF4136 domain-containing protein n=1 Tax=Pedobacter metabolipauper TaxID=425513 RepID=A0A4R6T0A4_9SPHI|nr:hypothetical protein [Pedobacter metabolipauper]TDQ11449.1 hypothetical protein ATK78_0571 [Pedobacter metabolipauper]